MNVRCERLIGTHLSWTPSSLDQTHLFQDKCVLIDHLSLNLIFVIYEQLDESYTMDDSDYLCGPEIGRQKSKLNRTGGESHWTEPHLVHCIPVSHVTRIQIQSELYRTRETAHRQFSFTLLIDPLYILQNSLSNYHRTNCSGFRLGW